MKTQKVGFHAQTTLGRALLACGLAMILSAGSVHAAGCPIEGPTSIGTSQSFTLCGVSGTGYSYEWQGQGLATSPMSRCVSVSGRNAGTYEYQLLVRRFGIEYERCSHVITVGSGDYGQPTCAIEGPEVIQPGTSARLCAPAATDAFYRWDGPGSFASTSRCVEVSATGTYYLTVRSRTSGEEQQCSQQLISTQAGGQGCTISGPASLVRGSTAELCSQMYSNSSSSWTGPNGYRSTARCIRVTVPGVYRVGIRNLTSGAVRECSFTLDDGGDFDEPDDGDVVTTDNCPRAVPFWQQQVRRTTNGRGVNPNDFILADLQVIARRIDDRSTYFNWSNDVAGLMAALNPPAPLTLRKQANRNLVVMAANVAAGELGITTRRGEAISLDPSTSITGTSAHTVGELIALAERMLAANRGSFSALSQRMNAVNRGRGIGPVCQ
jgi:hypothetical protein